MSTMLHNFDTRQKSDVLLLEEKLKKEGMLFELANFYRSQGEYTNAVIEIKALIRKCPCISYKLTLADIYVENSCYEQALLHVDELLKEITEENNFYYAVNLLKIECLIQLSQISEALQEISKVEAYIVDDELVSWRAVAYMKLNNFESALKCYQYSVTKNINNEKAWLGIGSIHCIKGDYSLGVSCFRKALDINAESIAAKNLIEKFYIKGDI